MQPARFRFRGFNKETIDEVVRSIVESLNGFEFSRFLVGCTFQDSFSEEARLLLKKEFQPLLVGELEKALNAKADFENPEIELLVNFNQDLVFFLVKPVFISGRYKKLSRGITQTVHYCFKCKGRGCTYCENTGILTKESVQSLIEKHALPLFQGSSTKFHGAGREDKDVRMLGSGREFVLEIVEPKKRKAGLKKLQEKINRAEKKKIEVVGLKFGSKKEVIAIKEQKSDKIYGAKISCENNIDMEKIEALEGSILSIEQRTPNRVKARRADIVRNRKAEIKKIEIISKKEFKAQIKAEAGLYVKEFVSGDEGRTNPSISSLLKNSCKCIELDVLEIVPRSLSQP